MANVEPIPRETLGSVEHVLAAAQATMGFVPNSMLTMSHMPQLTVAFSMLASTIFGADLSATMAANYQRVPEDLRADETLPPDLIQLIAFTVSVSSGCRYCQAHTSHNAHRFGISEEKLNSVLRHETSDLFTEAESAVVGLALAAGEVPNGSGPAHFAVLKAHYTERQITQIVGVISLFGFLNRWNDTMGTQLEVAPRDFAERTLAESGWQIGKHEAS
ncbi:MAG: carboxymuconolactone decarboxylase family protein [Pseudomonadota bacterium]|nr:carboxymuconolactone decarboxylase family protein [Pseudomonadota bacterium]